MSPHPRSVQHIDYKGWPNSLLLSNGLLEAVVVPAIDASCNCALPENATARSGKTR